MRASSTRSLALLLAAASAAQTVDEYRSNAIGMRLGPKSDAGDAGFVLLVHSVGDTEEDRLLDQGTEVRRTVRVYDASNGGTTEAVYEEGAVTVTRTYDSRARLVEEKNADERRVYRYRGNELETLEVSGPEGQPLYRERYGYTSSGRLREVDRSHADGSRSLSSFLFMEGRLLSERLQAGERVLTVRYDSSGRLVAEAERRGEALEWERTRRYDPATGTMAESVERRQDYTLSLLYDAAGRLVEDKRTGTGPYRSAYTYDDEGRQTRMRRIGPAGTEERQTEYDAEGRVARETYLARGRLQRVRVHTGEREWYDDLYRDGRPALRVTYRGDQKVGEERLP